MNKYSQPELPRDTKPPMIEEKQYTHFKYIINPTTATAELVLDNKLNLLNDSWFEELDVILSDVHTNDHVNVLLIWSSGPLFSAGLDLKNSFMPETNLGFYYFVKRWQHAISLLNTIVKPTVVAIHGKCVGGGIDFVSAADVRFCSADASFCIAEAKVGLAADIGTLQRIHHVCSSSLAREMVFGAEFVDADRALQGGLVSRVYPDKETLLEEARRYCEGVASLPPFAVQGSKVVMNYAMEHTVEEGLNQVALWNASFLRETSDDLMAAMQATMTKTKGTYRHRL
eukprot:TRINITY_DN3190_c0_g1_i1.p1 TRINITY_DN3190_c0_g1~~TRINITY_DN3190_c0_g1_i1.p1  ORF type:complete len:285 (+),score=49.01 TRINITY_DN3190_c0_g1_i1:165-1019(+)